MFRLEFIYQCLDPSRNLISKIYFKNKKVLNKNKKVLNKNKKNYRQNKYFKLKKPLQS